MRLFINASPKQNDQLRHCFIIQKFTLCVNLFFSKVKGEKWILMTLVPVQNVEKGEEKKAVLQDPT